MASHWDGARTSRDPIVYSLRRNRSSWKGDSNHHGPTVVGSGRWSLPVDGALFDGEPEAPPSFRGSDRGSVESLLVHRADALLSFVECFGGAGSRSASELGNSRAARSSGRPSVVPIPLRFRDIALRRRGVNMRPQPSGKSPCAVLQRFARASPSVRDLEYLIRAPSICRSSRRVAFALSRSVSDQRNALEDIRDTSCSGMFRAVCSAVQTSERTECHSPSVVRGWSEPDQALAGSDQRSGVSGTGRRTEKGWPVSA